VRPQSVIAVVLALVFGGSAAVGVRQYIVRNSAPQVETLSVVVAASGMPRGMQVSPALIKKVAYPKQLVPEGAILKVEDAEGRSTFTALAKDEPLLDSKLSPKGYRGLASLIPAGMRAFTISTVNIAAGVAGFILPGNKVDVLLTVANTGSNDQTGGGSTTTLLQNVEILAVDQKVEAPAENKVDTKELRSVTLLVTPDQAAKLDLGQNKGTLHLTLRNPEDTFAASVRPVTVKDIQYLQESPGRPWDERAKDLLKAWGEAFAKARQAAPPLSQKPPVQAAATPRKSIRTLRGSNEGMVIVTPQGSS
jgi:pilus assembly protein CpaB